MALDGQTIHSFAGIGIPRTPEDFRKTIKNKKRWKDLKVLILDEASMVSGEFFDRLSEVVSSIRGDWRPFGGIQLVVCGDFLQLSPIPPRPSDVQEMTAALQLEAGEDANDLLFLNRGFLFQSKAWRQSEFEVVELEQVFRQKNNNFVAVLEEIRRARLTPEGLSFLRTYCQRPLPPNDFGIRPTILHSMNKDVSRENLQELNQLKGETQVYGTVDTVEREKGAGKWVETVLLKNQFFTSCIAEKELQLKVGAQVMLVKNDVRGAGKNLVNGSRGKVVGFEAIKKSTHADDPLLPGVTLYPVVQFVTGGKKTIRPTLFQSRLVGLGTCTRLSLPLRLAWAITTHKSQGLTLDYVIADVGNVFAEAQAYVALSRASDENGLELRNFSTSRVRANKMALAFYENPGQVFRYWDGSVPERINHGNQKIDDEDPSAPEPVRQLTRATPARQASIGSSIQGKTFVFSGILTSMPRSQAEDLVQQRRGVVRGSVSGKTNFLVLGETMKNGRPSILGADFAKAKTIVEGGTNVSNLQLLTEKQFFQWIKLKD
jgi:ATP-dependent DNA helicase PIF1